jgi:hypothetical protein
MTKRALNFRQQIFEMKKDFLLTLTALILCASAACQSSETKPQPQPTPARSEFESDLDYVKRSYSYGLTHIYVLSRRDGAAFEKDDRDYLRLNMPREVYTTVVTDNGRKAIVGTNIDFSDENRKALTKRFTIEDYSNR